MSVLFATPTRGNYAAEYVTSLRETMMMLGREGIPFGFIDAEGNNNLSLVRDQMSAAFLDQFDDAENLFFIDDDLGWPAAKIVEFVRRPEEIVLGVYPLKNDSGAYVCNLVEPRVARDGLIQVREAPAGFCCIKRGTLRKIADASPKYIESGASVSYRGILYQIFAQGVHGGMFVEGDIAFVRRATKLGIDVWLDPDIEFTHRGVHVWHGRFADALA